MNGVRISAPRRMRRDETGRTKHDVGEDLVLVHLDVTDGNTQAKNLLHPERDRLR